MKKDVFISYHKDSAAEYVEHIAKRLEERNISCWYAHRDSEGNYADIIEQAISETPIFLFILNRGSDASPDCLDEVHIAHEKYKNGQKDHMIIFRIEQCGPTKGMKYYIGGLHIMDGIPAEEKLPYLLDRIETKLGRNMNILPSSDGVGVTDEKNQIDVPYDPVEDLKETVKRAEENDPKAMYVAAMMYSWGFGTGIGWDYEKATYWLNKAMETDTYYAAKSKALLGDLNYRGQVPRKQQSFEESFKLRASIDKNKYPGLAFRKLLFMITNGLGCNYSFDEINSFLDENSANIIDDGLRINAAKYYIKTSQFYEAIRILESTTGHRPEAEYLLGEIYHRGLHDESRHPDIIKAESCYRKAADAGWTDAIWMMGMINFHGAYGHKQDLTQARAYFRKGALAGHGECQYVYAWLCKNGLGGVYDGDEAIKFFNKGAERGYDSCMYELAIMYQQPEYRDDKAAFTWAKRAADLGETTGKFLVGWLYLMGRGCDYDVEKACYYLKEAKDEGYLDAEDILEKAEALRKEGKPFFRLKEKLPEAKRDFYGRQTQLEEIERKFREGNRILFFEGMGGIGKTELAKVYAKTHRNEYNRILFVTYRSNLRELVLDENSFEITGFERVDGESDEEWFGRKLREIHSLTDSRTLIITDNYDIDIDPDFELYTDGDCRMIFTTRNSHPGFSSIYVGKIEDEDALLNIFKANCGYEKKMLDDQEKKTIMDIIHMVDSHTYTIELLARQMQASRLYPAELWERLHKGGLADIGVEKVPGKAGEKNAAYEHIKSVFTASRLNSDEKQIMRLLSFQGVEGIPVDKFKAWAGLPSYDVVNELKEKRWIREDIDGKLSLHPVVAEVMRTELKPSCANCAEFLERMTDYLFDAWRRPFSENVVVKGCVLSTINWFQDFDELSIDIWDATVNFLWQVGSFSESVKYARIFYDKCLIIYGNNSDKTAYAARTLGEVYFSTGDKESAHDWFEKAAQYYEKNGEHTEEAAEAYEHLGKLYYQNEKRRDLELANKYLDKSVEIRKELIDTIKQGGSVIRTIQRYFYRYDLTEATDYLAGCYLHKGRVCLVREEYDKAYKYISLCEELHGENYYDRSPSSYALIKMYKGICQYHMAKEMNGQALQNLEKSLGINLKYRGNSQIDTIDNKEWLGDLYAAMGDAQIAGKYYQEVIDSGMLVFGRDPDRIKKVEEKLEKVTHTGGCDKE